MLIKEAKNGRLIFWEIDKRITLMLLDKFFDYLKNIKEDIVW